ncbi:hypothetical protein Lesp01_26160 [Lentzea sp. NBRC 102530]|nr:hypothetical protein Lesp01_26160 [Lentzea sp. NBRC 102530]
MNRGTTSAITPHLLTGAHALDALPDAERGEFEAHPARCPACADEVAGLRETTALHGRAVRWISPAALRPRVLNAVRSVRQAPPTSEITRFPTRQQGLRRAAAGGFHDVVAGAGNRRRARGRPHGGARGRSPGPAGAPVLTIVLR